MLGRDHEAPQEIPPSIGIVVELLHLGHEALGVLELAEHEVDGALVVAGLQDLARDAPHLGELAVVADDPALAVHDQDAVGGGLQRRRHQRERKLQLLTRCTELGLSQILQRLPQRG